MSCWFWIMWKYNPWEPWRSLLFCQRGFNPDDFKNCKEKHRRGNSHTHGTARSSHLNPAQKYSGMNQTLRNGLEEHPWGRNWAKTSSYSACRLPPGSVGCGWQSWRGECGNLGQDPNTSILLSSSMCCWRPVSTDSNDFRIHRITKSQNILSWKEFSSWSCMTPRNVVILGSRFLWGCPRSS